MCPPPSKPSKQFVLKKEHFFLGGLALHNTGFFQRAQVHIFPACDKSGAVMFCSKASAQLVAKSLLAHGMPGWKVEEVEQ